MMMMMITTSVTLYLIGLFIARNWAKKEGFANPTAVALIWPWMLVLTFLDGP